MSKSAHNILLTDDDIELIISALSYLPYKDVVILIQSIDYQLNKIIKENENK